MALSDWLDKIKEYNTSTFHLASLCLVGFFFMLIAMMTFNTYYSVDGLRNYKVIITCEPEAYTYKRHSHVTPKQTFFAFSMLLTVW
jgi:hypothetical protein